jgi:hypothetical protein
MALPPQQITSHNWQFGQGSNNIPLNGGGGCYASGKTNNPLFNAGRGPTSVEIVCKLLQSIIIEF